MFTRGRPCLRRRGLSAVLDNVVAGPEEPLLFLYPRWYTSAVRPVAQFSTATATKGSHGRALPRGIRSRRFSFRRPRRWVSTDAGIKVGRVDSDSATARDHDIPGFIEGGVETNDQTPTTSGTWTSTPSIRPYNSSIDIETIAQTRSQNVRTGAAKTHTRPLAVPINRFHRARRFSARDQKKLRYRSYQQEVQGPEQTRAWRQCSRVRSLLERMQRDTRMSTRKGKQMLVPEETIALLAGITDMAMKENIWYEHVHNGCRVHVLRPLDSKGQYRRVFLSGSERAVELVMDRFKKAQSLQANGDPLVDIRKPPVPVFPSIEAMKRRNLPVPIVRGVWDFYQAAGRPLRLDELLATPRDVASIREFAEYVEDLTRSQHSRSRPKSDRPYVAHENQVGLALLDLFSQDANRKFFSTAALNRALTYLYEHESLATCRAVFIRAEHFATVDTFNILLKSAAQRQDLIAYRSFLLSMLRSRIRPDPYTWLTFLDCLVEPQAKASLVMQILKKGYLNQTSAKRSAIQLTIQDTFMAHLESGQSVESFINTILETSGGNWFPPSLLGQMFSVTARLKDYDTMNRLLEICEQQGLNITSSTLNPILNLFRADIFSALHYVYRCNDRPVFKVQGQTFEKLFLIAFKGRHYNLCRVIWRYACMDGAVSYKMKEAVLASLLRNVPPGKGSEFDKTWRTGAGKVIIGIDLHTSHYPIHYSILNDIPPEFRSVPAQYLIGFKPSGEDRSRQSRLAKALVNRDIEDGAKYKPVEPLSIMLESAAILDREWKGIPRPIQWMMQQAIRVPVKRTDFT